MTLTEPTLAPPMAPSTVDMAQIFASHAERAARIDALRVGNKDRLFDGLKAAGITHVTVTFDGAGDSGQKEFQTTKDTLGKNKLWTALPFVADDHIVPDEMEMTYGSPSAAMAFLDVVQKSFTS